MAADPTKSGDAQGHILLVDDEPTIREPLAEYLMRYGYQVTEAADAVAARACLEQSDVSLALIDIMMPGEDGLSLTTAIRAQGRLPVILLTARTEDTDRIVGLEIGADDYVVKPFNPRELLARIKAVLRRTTAEPQTVQSAAEQVYRFAGFDLDPGRRQLRRDGAEIILTGGEFALLLALIERAGRLLGREQLLDITQGREAALFDRSIDNQISRLRKKIENDPKAPDIIKTVRGGGYVLAVPVTQG